MCLAYFQWNSFFFFHAYLPDYLEFLHREFVKLIRLLVEGLQLADLDTSVAEKLACTKPNSIFLRRE